MIPLEALQALDAIDRKGSFAAAAEELFRVPSAITYTIKKLEEQLNIKLFDRNKQRAKLTPTGKLMLEKGREILRQVQQLEAQAQQTETGWESHLRIVVDTIIPCEPFWPLLNELKQQQPWLHIQVIDEALSGSWEALTADRADLIIGVSGDEPAGANCQRHCLGHLRMQLCCNPDHPAAQLAQPINREQLKDFTHILVNDSASYLPQRNVGLLGIRQTLSVSNLQQKVSALCHGVGISHLPSYLADPMFETGQLVHLDTGAEHSFNPFYMSWKPSQSGKANDWLRKKIIEEQVLAHLLS
ncbi:transcriptional regulator, LysR family [gamma proteobacterium IMCC1989]|nr:transcriptional regulator, LysR family [gamma proteobacterium IMCC1989]